MGGSGRDAGVQGTLIGRFLLGGLVSKSLSSEVRLATDTESNKVVALKIMQKEWIWKNDMSSLVRREIAIMRELNHPCLSSLVEVFNSETHVFMAIDTLDGGSMRDELRRGGLVDEARARGLFQQLMMAVKYLHSMGVAHRNLKLENVRLSKDGTRVKLWELGLAIHLDEGEGSTKNRRQSSRGPKGKPRRQLSECDGTPAYAAPEVIRSPPNTRHDARRLDTWCAGVCLFAMVTGKAPFRASSEQETLDAVRMKEPNFPEQLSPLLTDLLQGMLRKNPLRRLTVDGVLRHPWTARSVTVPPSLPADLPEETDLAEATHLAEAAKVAVREAKLAASVAERAAAAAAAAEANAAKALAAVKHAAAAAAAAAEATTTPQPPPTAEKLRAPSPSPSPSHGGDAGLVGNGVGGRSDDPPTAAATAQEEGVAARKKNGPSSSSSSKKPKNRIAYLLGRWKSTDRGGRKWAAPPSDPLAAERRDMMRRSASADSCLSGVVSSAVEPRQDEVLSPVARDSGKPPVMPVVASPQNNSSPTNLPGGCRTSDENRGNSQAAPLSLAAERRKMLLRSASADSCREGISTIEPHHNKEWASGARDVTRAAAAAAAATTQPPSTAANLRAPSPSHGGDAGMVGNGVVGRSDDPPTAVVATPQEEWVAARKKDGSSLSSSSKGYKRRIAYLLGHRKSTEHEGKKQAASQSDPLAAERRAMMLPSASADSCLRGVVSSSVEPRRDEVLSPVARDSSRASAMTGVASPQNNSSLASVSEGHRASSGENGGNNQAAPLSLAAERRKMLLRSASADSCRGGISTVEPHQNKEWASGTRDITWVAKAARTGGVGRGAGRGAGVEMIQVPGKKRADPAAENVGGIVANGGAARGSSSGGEEVEGRFAKATGKLSVESNTAGHEMLGRSRSIESVKTTTAGGFVAGAEEAPPSGPKGRSIERIGIGSGSMADRSLPSTLAVASSPVPAARPVLAFTPPTERSMSFDLAVTPMNAGRGATTTSAAAPRWQSGAETCPLSTPSLPPPIEHSMSFDVAVTPMNAGRKATTTRAAGPRWRSGLGADSVLTPLLPPPIQHSMSFDLTVSAVPSARRTSSSPPQPQRAAGAETVAVAAAEATKSSRGAGGSPDAHAAGDNALTAAKEGTSYSSLSSATTIMSTSPTKEVDTVPPASRDFAAPSPREEWPSLSGAAPIHPVASATDLAPGKVSDPSSPSSSARSQSPSRVPSWEPALKLTVLEPADSAAVEQSAKSASPVGAPGAAFSVRCVEEPLPAEGGGETVPPRAPRDPVASSMTAHGTPNEVEEGKGQRRDKADDVAAVNEWAVKEVNEVTAKQVDGTASTRAPPGVRGPSGEEPGGAEVPPATAAAEEDEEEDMAAAEPSDTAAAAAAAAAASEEAEARTPVRTTVGATAAAAAVDPDAAALAAASSFDDTASSKTRPLPGSGAFLTATEPVAERSAAASAGEDGSRASPGKPSGAAAYRQTPVGAEAGPAKVETAGKVNLAAAAAATSAAAAAEKEARESTVTEGDNKNPPAAVEESAVSDQVRAETSRVEGSVLPVKAAKGPQQAVVEAAVGVKEVAGAPVTGERAGEPTVLEGETHTEAPGTTPLPSLEGLRSSRSRGGGVEEDTGGDRKQDEKGSAQGDGGQDGSWGGDGERDAGSARDRGGGGDGAEAAGGEGGGRRERQREREREDSGEFSPRVAHPGSTSRTPREVVWQAIDPTEGDANGGSLPAPALSAPTSAAAAARRQQQHDNTPQLFTFQEFMTGMKDAPLPEMSGGRSSGTPAPAPVARRERRKASQPSGFKEPTTGSTGAQMPEICRGRSWDSPARSDYGDDDAESAYGGGGAVTDTDTVVNPAYRDGFMTAASRAESIKNIRKLAAAESIWESGSALARKGGGNDDDGGRVVSGRYHRVKGQVRSRTVQPGRQARRGRIEGPTEELSESVQQQDDETERSRSGHPEPGGRTSQREERSKWVRQQRRQQQEKSETRKQKQEAKRGRGAGGELAQASETTATTVAVAPDGKKAYKPVGGTIRGPAPANHKSIGKRISSLFGRKSF